MPQIRLLAAQKVPGEGSTQSKKRLRSVLSEVDPAFEVAVLADSAEPSAPRRERGATGILLRRRWLCFFEP